MTMMKCSNCGEVFDEDEAVKIPEYVDDSRIIAFYSFACPFCMSDDVDDYWEDAE